MDERTYFDEKNVLITNLRLVFRHDTIPIDRISLVDTNLRVKSLVVSFICFIFSPCGFYWGGVGIVAVATAFAYLRWSYVHYAELSVVVDGKKIKVLNLSAGDANRQYIYKVADILSTAIADNEREREFSGFDQTETMQLKTLLKELDGKKQKD